MTTKMKGLLKGLRYISQIFDNGNYKEQEMEIGYPTDVKHVAHIGWDGPSINTPSWMNEAKPVSNFSSQPLNTVGGEAKEKVATPWSSHDLKHVGVDSPVRDRSTIPKSSRRQQSTDVPALDSPRREFPDIPKQSRRRSSIGAPNQSAGSSADSPTKEYSDMPRHSRRQQNSSLGGDSSSASDIPGVPKQSRRKKSKDGSSRGSRRPSQSKASVSLSDPDLNTDETKPDQNDVKE